VTLNLSETSVVKDNLLSRTVLIYLHFILCYNYKKIMTSKPVTHLFVKHNLHVLDN